MADISDLTVTFSCTMSDPGAHVSVTHEPHVTDGRWCWCGPRFYRVCDECDEPPGCWKCERGLIEVSRCDAETAGEPLIVMHR